MRSRLKVFAMLSIVFVVLCAMVCQPTRAISNLKLSEYSQNDILYYDPSEDSCSGGGGATCFNGTELTWADFDECGTQKYYCLAKKLISTYGEFAMALQEEYGYPWEVLFGQMLAESEFGMSSNSGDWSHEIRRQSGDTEFNLMGITVEDEPVIMNWADNEYDLTSGSHKWPGFKDISSMLVAYTVEFPRRQGSVSQKMEVLKPDNYDLEGYVKSYLGGYSQSSTQADNVLGFINGNWGGNEWNSTGVIGYVRDELGLPSSAELAKQKNIQPGGRWATNEYTGSQELSKASFEKYGTMGLDCGGSGGGKGGSSSKSSGGAAIAEKAKELSWPVGTDTSVFTGKDYKGNDAYNTAAKALGAGFVNPLKAGECDVSTSTNMCYSCARFVSLALYESGADQDFIDETKAKGNNPHMIGTDEGDLTYYLTKSDNWSEVTDYDGNGYDDLQAGDILLWDKGKDGIKSDGIKWHTFIYVGDGIVAEASNSDYAPYLHEWTNGNNGYKAYRMKGGTDKCNGTLQGNVLRYAWPEWNATRKDAREEYQALVESGQYYNGGGVTDCNGFVTKMIIVSDIDPEYNSGSWKQCAGTLQSMQNKSGFAANWETLYKPGDAIDTSNLQPGDVFLNDHHTFLFVGDIPGFQCDLASASLGDHVPVACQGDNVNAEWYSGGEYYVFRKK